MKIRSLIRPLVLAAIAACSTAQAAPLLLSDYAVSGPATTVRFANLTPRLNGTLSAGGFRSSVTGASDPALQNFVSWCIDIFQPAKLGTTVNDYTQLTLAQYGSLSAERGAMLGNLASIAYDQALTSSVSSAAFQLAVWEIVNETSHNLDLSKNTFKAWGATDGSLALAQQWLNALPQQQTRFGFDIFASATAQDVIRFYELPKPPLAAATAESVPEPGALALIALAGVAAAATRRRRALPV